MTDGRDMNDAVRRGAALWADVAVVGVLGGSFGMLFVAGGHRLHHGRRIILASRMAEVQDLRRDGK